MNRQEIIDRLDVFRDILKACNSSTSELDYFEKCILGLFDRSRSFSKGDRVKLRTNLGLDISKKSGWYHLRQDLTEGAVGTIIEVEINTAGFRYIWQPDVCTWADHKGDVRPCSKSAQHRLSLSGDKLTLVCKEEP